MCSWDEQIRRTLDKGRSAKVIQFNTGNKRQYPGIPSSGKESENVHEIQIPVYNTGNRITLRSIGNEHNIGNPLCFSNNRDSDIGVGFAEERKSTGNKLAGNRRAVPIPPWVHTRESRNSSFGKAHANPTVIAALFAVAETWRKP